MKSQLDLNFGPSRRKPVRRRRVGRKLVPLGRRPSPERAGQGYVPHVAREVHSARCPVHVTMRRIANAPSFRAERVSNAIMAQLARATRPSRSGSTIRVVHFSIQDDHLHLMLEGTSAQDLSRQAQKLFSRIALAVNVVAGRRGALFRDRHHRHELKTPTEVRRALVYILFNTRKHAGANSLGNPRSGIFEWFDPLTSAAWFEGWSPHAGPPPTAAPTARSHFTAQFSVHDANAERERDPNREHEHEHEHEPEHEPDPQGEAERDPKRERDPNRERDPAPVIRPDTWLARVGWQRAGGLIRFDELPRILA